MIAVCLKAYGDFAIALTCWRSRAKAPQGHDLRLLASAHLRPLAEALGAGEMVEFIEHDAEVPAVFDIRRRGPRAAWASLRRLRRELERRRAEAPFVFDRLGLRERLIAGTAPAIGLPDRDNIYLAYAAGVDRLGLESADPVVARPPERCRSAVLVPASRWPTKTMPASTLLALHQRLSAAGIETRTLVLDGDVVEVPPGLPTERLPRSFGALVAALRDGHDLVVSADSLAAHIAEHVGLPSFVASPVANRYWLPLTSFTSSGWCLFGDEQRLSRWLEHRMREKSLKPTR